MALHTQMQAARHCKWQYIWSDWQGYQLLVMLPYGLEASCLRLGDESSRHVSRPEEL